jgi:hypothetical protein
MQSKGFQNENGRMEAKNGDRGGDDGARDERPWLAMAFDVSSRTIFSALLTHEPSVLSALLCLRQVFKESH